MTDPLLAPLPVAEVDEELRPALTDPAGPGGRAVLNVFATLAHHPKLLKRWLVFGNHVLTKSTLAPRERELLILRTGWLCRSPYEWGQHVVIGRAVGIGDDEIRRVCVGSDAREWSERDSLLLRAAEELHRDQCLAASTYAALTHHLDEQQILDLIFTVGQYHIVAMALNSCRVARDDGVDDTSLPFPVHPDDA